MWRIALTSNIVGVAFKVPTVVEAMPTFRGGQLARSQLELL